MYAKFLYGGEGAKVPYTDFGFSFSLFKVWFCPTGGSWAGYTTASLNGLLGAAIVESPVVEVVTRDLEDEDSFTGLHGSTVDVTISPSTFIRDGGVASINLKRWNNDSIPPKEISFFSDQCKGASLAVTNIHFTATLLMLPPQEMDPNGSIYVPW